VRDEEGYLEWANGEDHVNGTVCRPGAMIKYLNKDKTRSCCEYDEFDKLSTNKGEEN
jgi:hypothetical protein